jgi:hypothetical protein
MINLWLASTVALFACIVFSIFFDSVIAPWAWSAVLTAWVIGFVGILRREMGEDEN